MLDEQEDNITHEMNGILAKQLKDLSDNIKSFAAIVKRHNDELIKLDRRVTELEKRLTGVVLPNQAQALLDRYMISSKCNRNLNETPERLAFAAYLTSVKQIPSVHIYKWGVLSQSKLQGLKSWSTQHTVDYFELNHVTHIYQHGLSDEEMKNLLPPEGYEQLVAYLAKRVIS